MDVEKAAEKCHQIIETINQQVIGKRTVLEKILITILAGGHILFEDYPGLGKTLMANLFAQIFSAQFHRIQFTPDLLPADILGGNVFNQKTMDFELKKGPIFGNFILADEINRAPPKTQAALLEAMQEYQVSIDGKSYPLEKPYIVLATQNPIELEGTFPLPEAEIDRFMIRLSVGYPDSESEMIILKNRMSRKKHEINIDPLSTPEELRSFQQLCEEIHVDDSILMYIVEIVQSTRRHPRVHLGASPRGSLALLSLARASALFNGRDYVIPQDVKDHAILALNHRIIVKASEWLGGTESIRIINEILETVPAPRKKDFSR